jgi:hypothetical protein
MIVTIEGQEWEVPDQLEPDLIRWLEWAVKMDLEDTKPDPGPLFRRAE